jgi:hypothetical protein
MIESYPFSIPDSRQKDLEIALETGAFPPWQRYPASEEPRKASKWNPETAQEPWFQEAAGEWHSQAQDLVYILLDRLKAKDHGMMPEVALVKALALMMDDLAAMRAASYYTWMFDPVVLKALERQKEKEKSSRDCSCAAKSGAAE